MGTNTGESLVVRGHGRAVGHQSLSIVCQVEEDERLQPLLGQHLRPQRTCDGRLHGAHSSGSHAHREVVHGSRGPEGYRPRAGGAGDPLLASRCARMTVSGLICVSDLS